MNETESDGLPNVPPPKQTFLPFRSLVDALATDAGKRYDAAQAGRPFGAITALPKLDNELGGALAPGLHIVHGSAGVGKTAFGLQIASSCLCPALYVTCEMTPLELLRRQSARVTGKYLGYFKDGSLTAEEVHKLASRGAAAAPLLALLDATEIPATGQEVFEKAKITRDFAPDSGHLLVVVDSLHTWADMTAPPGTAEYDRLNEGLAGLRTLSKTLDCAVIAIAERNRGSKNDSGQSSGAGTRKIEYGAETIIALDADDVPYDGEGKKEVRAKISKNRSGAAGKTIKLYFYGREQKYTEAAF